MHWKCHHFYHTEFEQWKMEKTPVALNQKMPTKIFNAKKTESAFAIENNNYVSEC